jgi:Tol biopolymer transport system component
MLSGRRPFVGETTTDVLAAIIHREPEWNALSAGVPLTVRHVLERCLEKDPKRRLRDIGDARVELEQSLEASTRGGKVITRDSAPPGRRPRRWPAVAAALLVVAVALLSWPSIRSRLSRRPPEPTVVPLTTYTGTEQMPSLSPDGHYVAFQWNGEAEDNPDIYVKLVGPGDPIQLTRDPGQELLPTWSPDGTRIAFLREEGEPGAIPPSTATLTLSGLQYRLGVYVIPALGGATRRVGDATVPSLAWADSRTLVISRSPAANQPAGLATLSIETGQVSQLTSPAPPPFDRLAAMSPDGETVAFQRVLGPPSVWALMLVSLSRSSQAIREPREVGINQTLIGGGIGHIAWSADGREIIYAAGWGLSFLWRIAPSGNSPPERLTFAGEAASQPTTSRNGSRLVFSRSLSETNIWSLELDERGRAKGPAAQVFNSSRSEVCPAFSPDGTRVAFQSNRSSINAIWTCSRNGSGCSQVTQFAGAHAGSPAWSPNGQWIAFDGSEAKGSAIYIVRPDGSQLRRLADGVIPRWSRDGRWIYYSGNRPQGLYRVSSTGGNPESVSGTADGWVAEESPDGQWIYYSGAPVNVATRLRRASSRGGQATDVLPEQISGRNFAVAEAGIWYLTPSPSVKEGSLLRYYDFASKITRTVYRTEHPVGPGMTLAPDGRRILFTQQDRRGSDLMLVENFR